MLTEITADYYTSCKKSILDYVLQDEKERLRIGIVQILKPPVDYGTVHFVGILPDESWTEYINNGREKTAENLCICNEATLACMNIWAEHEKELFIRLPVKGDDLVTLGKFSDDQELNINSVRTKLVDKWKDDIIKIYREELQSLTKRQRLIFFRSNATLMSNQIRQLIYDSLNTYCNFIKRFQLEKYKTPTEIILQDRNIHGTIEDAFMVVSLNAKNGTVVFQIGLEKIKSNMLKIVTDIINTSQHFPRPEKGMHSNTKGEQTLSAVTIEDETYNRVLKEIRQIIDDNFVQIKEVIHIFDEFKFLLTELKRVQDVLEDDTRTVLIKRSHFKEALLKYQTYWERIRVEIPFMVNFNMMAVDCTEIKQLLLDSCFEIECKLLEKISDNIIDTKTKIQSRINEILQKIRQSADRADELVELEEYIEKIRSKEESQIKQKFDDNLAWVQLLYNTSHCDKHGILEQLFEGSKLVDTIETMLIRDSDRLYECRQLIEQKLTKDILEFELELKKFNKDIVEFLSEQDSKEQKTNVIQTLDKYDKSMQYFLHTKNDINKRQALLRMVENEFKDYSKAERYIEPYHKLWNLIAKFMD